MSDGLTAGFDLCLEIDDDLLSGAVSSLRGQTIPPLPLALPGSGASTGSLTLVAESIILRAALPSPSVNLIFGFLDSALQLQRPGQPPGHAGSLRGALHIGPLSVVLNDRPNHQKVFGLEVPDGVDVQLSFQAGASRQAVQRLLDSYQAGFADLQAGVASVVRALLPALLAAGDLSPLAFQMTGDEIGSLTPLQFLGVDLATVPATSQQPGVLCVLGTLLPPPASRPDPAAKTLAGLQYPHRVAIEIAPQAARELIICPALPGAVGVSPPQGLTTWPALHRWLHATLPPLCGVGDGLTIPTDEVDARLRFVSFDFREGAIRFSGVADGEKTGGSATATFDADISVGVAAGQVSVSGQLVDFHVTVTIDWWVSFLLGLAIPFFGGVFTAEGIRNLMEQKVAGQVVDRLKSGLSSLTVDLSGVAGDLTIETAEVRPDGILVQGTVPRPAPPPLREPEVIARVVGEREIAYEESEPLQEKGVGCMEGTYTYREHRSSVEKRIAATVSNMTPPFTYTWTVGGQPIDPAGSQYLGVNSDSALMWSFEWGGQVLKLLNIYRRASFAVEVSCRAVDVNGIEAQSPTILVQYHVVRREYGPDYTQRLRECVQSLLKDLGRGPVQGPLPRPPAPDRAGISDLVDVYLAARARGIGVSWLENATRASALLSSPSRFRARPTLQRR
jgi:hypothetical protein